MMTLLICLALTAQAKPKAGAAETTDWNQFRGPKRDGIAPDTGLLKEWAGSGPPIAWKVKGVGTGYSSVCVSGARVYTMGEIGGDYCLIALNVADGKMVWTAKIAKVQDVPYPGTRTTPATDGTIGQTSRACQRGRAPDEAFGYWRKENSTCCAPRCLPGPPAMSTRSVSFCSGPRSGRARPAPSRRT